MPLKFYSHEPAGHEESARQLARNAADALLRPHARADDESAYFRRDCFSELARLGLTSLSVPARLGGGGQASRAHFAALEELARGSVAMAVTVGVQNLVQGAVVHFGTPAQQSRYLPLLVSGESLGAFSLSEPNYGSDSAAIVLQASRAPGGYRLSGTKAWCSNGGAADLYLVMARTSADPKHGLSAFLVPAGANGFRAGKQERKMGLRGGALSQLFFDDCFVSQSERVGPEGRGLEVALSQLDSGRVAIGCIGLGASIEALERLLDHVRQSDLAASATGEGVLQELGGHYASIQAARSLVAIAADMRDRQERLTIVASQIKLLGSDLAMRITSEVATLAVHAGVDTRFPFERLFRDAKALQIVEGTNQIQQAVLARKMQEMMGF